MERPLLLIEEIDVYYGKSHVLHDVSVAVNEGEVVSLLGRNGSGRSTTLKTVMGVLRPKRGRITFRGKSIAGALPFRIVKGGITYVPEGRRVFANLTIAQNLRLAILGGRKGPWDENRIYEAFPVLGERRNTLARLSGGEQQMLAIARALIANPSIILLDEPMEGLAPIVAAAVEEIVLRLRADGNTILLVEQNADVALRLSDRGYILNNGRVVVSGTAEELRSDEEAMRRHLAV